MLEILLDTLIDAVRLLPFLFIAFILMELIEHKLTNKNKKIIEHSGKFGPFVGALLGAFPQCGFSAAATNLFSSRIITVGTLIAIYLSTSDEMLPILITNGTDISIIIKILLIKVVIGMTCGFIIDLILKNRKANQNDSIQQFCDEEHCHCNHGIIKSSIIHTLNILLFIAGISLLLNIALYYLGEDNLSKLFLKNSIFGPFVSALVGLIPNCASSVVITELYLNNSITLGSTIAGLLAGSGVGILLLFRTNKNLKQNINILLTIYFVGSICGILIDLFKLTI